ncbi:MAG: efflux RND transporter periplasmic adaptor subunit [Pseudomonadota bacterium]|nr:efflux RND transporter periplasmic adaptor subunit [Pseudomonadota bacterium]
MLRLSLFAVVTALLMLALSISLTAAEKPTEQLTEALDDSAMEHALKHQDPRYVCPMHAQIVRDEPGSCPICGMDLVAKKVPQKSYQKPAEKKILYWVAPMDPNYRREEPGQSPMGMDLVPVYDEGVEGGDGDYPAITINPTVMNNLGLRTATATLQDLKIEIRTPGVIDYDETRISHIHPRAEGWFEKLHVRAEGDPVKAGDTLGDFYSPDILAAQVDFLVALNSSQRGKLDSARNGLRLLGVEETTIQQIEKQRQTQNSVPVVSPASGIITKLGVREGMYAVPSSETFAIADLDHVWVKVDVYEHLIAALKSGLDAEIRVPAWPERVWRGKIEYIYPQLNAKSRTLGVRLSFANVDHALKPNMFAEVVIEAAPKLQVVTIPKEALIITGERKAVVRALGDGRFQPVDVTTGITQAGMTEIVSGIEAGDKVVISAQFLIDSESALQASFLRLSSDSSSDSSSDVSGD